MAKKLSQKVKLVGVEPGSREYRRISRGVTRLEKRGYIFPSNAVITQATNLYEVARYIDQQTDTVISGLERLNQERQIAARKGWVTRRKNALRQGEITPEEQTHLANELNNVIAEIYRKIDTWQPKEIWQKDKGKRVNSQTFEEVKRRDKNKLRAWLDFAIATEGRDVVAARAQAQPDTVNYLAEQIMYGNSGTAADNNYMQGELTELASILLGRKLTTHESTELEEQVESFMPA